jgi:hypothetical protein
MKNPHVFCLLNCSLSPEPESLMTISQAFFDAITHDINVTYKVMKNKSNPGLMGGITIAHMLVHPEYSHMYLIGDDVLYPRDSLIKLVKSDKDIIGGVYKVRDSETFALGILGTVEENREAYIKGELKECRWNAAHSLLVKKETIMKMIEKFPELRYKTLDGFDAYGLFLDEIIDNELNTGDAAFCRRAATAGCTTWVDYSVKLSHKFGGWSAA